jgi:hypothetical protein
MNKKSSITPATNVSTEPKKKRVQMHSAMQKIQRLKAIKVSNVAAAHLPAQLGAVVV